MSDSRRAMEDQIRREAQHVEPRPQAAAGPMTHAVDPTRERVKDTRTRDKASDIRETRTDRYGLPRNTLDRLSEQWTSLLRSRYPGVDVEIDPSLVGLMMVCLKLHRAATPSHKSDRDDYVDAHNYLDFAEEADTLVPSQIFVSIPCRDCGLYGGDHKANCPQRLLDEAGVLQTDVQD